MALTKIPRGLLDTGIADSSDATAITIDSSENITFAGRVGIAVAPTYTFTVEKAVTDDWLSRIYNTGTAEGDNGVLIRTGSEHDGTSILSLYSGSTYKFKFQADGKLGIGTFNPAKPLHISSADNQPLRVESTDAYTGIELKDSGSATLPPLLSALSNDFIFYGGHASTRPELMRLTTGGVVLVGGVTNTNGGYQFKVGGSDNQGELALFSNATAADLLSYDRTNGHYNTLNIHASSTIFTQGNVGIGTNVGTSKINIYTGNVTGAGTLASSAINIAHTTHTNGMSQMTFGYQPGSLTYAAAYIGYIGVSQAGNGNGDLVFGTRTATSDTQPTERMRIDSNGYVQFGTSLTTHIGTNQVFINRGVNAAAATSGTTQTGGALRLRGGNNAVLDMGMNSTDTWIQATDRANLANGYNLALNPNGGGVSIGQANAGTSRLYTYSNTDAIFTGYFLNDHSGGYGVAIRSDSNSFMYFYNGGSFMGRIYHNGTTMLYADQSDYRLKENVQTMTGSIDRIKKLNPVTFDWKADGKASEGFLAHEVQEVVPTAVAGEKDAKITELGEGIQIMDYGKVTPVLVAALQEAIAKIEILEAKVAALESK